MTDLKDLQAEISGWQVTPDDALAQIGYDNEELLDASAGVAQRQMILLLQGSKEGMSSITLLDAAFKTMYALGFCLGVMAEKEKATESEEVK